MTLADRSISNGGFNKPTLLFVDDERRVLSSMRAMFRRDYHVFVADGGQEALEIVDREQIDVVISDQRMPKMTGVEFLCTVKERAPAAMRILLTGYADLEAIEASINEGEVFRYLMKPCPPGDLKRAIAQAIEAVRASDSGIEEIELHEVETSTSSQPAELISFPAARRALRKRASVHPIKPLTTKASASAGALLGSGGNSAPRGESKVDVLILSTDRALYAAIEEVADGHEVIRAVSVEQALEALVTHQVGVMITDTTANGPEVEALTKTLKQEVPELVTIIASERSDAHALISLINEGQIYRFLLKPLSRGQCRLWVTSAIRKFSELSSSEDAVARYRVVETADGGKGGLLESMRTGLRQLRARLKGD